MIVPGIPTAFLANPAAGDRAFPALARRLRLLALRHLLVLPCDELPAGMRRACQSLQRVLTRMLERDPQPLVDAIGNPDVMTLMLVSKSGLAPAADCLAKAVPCLLAALDANGALRSSSESILWDVALDRIVDSAGGRCISFTPPARALLADGAGLEAELDSGRRVGLSQPPAGIVAEGVACTHPFVPIVLGMAAPFHLSLVDTNPLAMVEAHPEKHGNALSLGSRDLSEWTRALGEAAELIRSGMPGWHAELPVALARIIPVGYEQQRHLSASYREAPGVAYLSLHPKSLTMAEAIVHETQHTKLNTLAWFDPVLNNAWTSWTQSPVRPDLRPLMGVLLAAHAFIPVATLHASLAHADHPVTRTPEFRRRRAEVLASNSRALSVLAKEAEPTAAGGRLLRDLERLHAALLGDAPDLGPAVTAGEVEPS